MQWLLTEKYLHLATVAMDTKGILGGHSPPFEVCLEKIFVSRTIQPQHFTLTPSSRQESGRPAPKRERAKRRWRAKRQGRGVKWDCGITMRA